MLQLGPVLTVEALSMKFWFEKHWKTQLEYNVMLCLHPLAAGGSTARCATSSRIKNGIGWLIYLQAYSDLGSAEP